MLFLLPNSIGIQQTCNDVFLVTGGCSSMENLVFLLPDWNQLIWDHWYHMVASLSSQHFKFLVALMVAGEANWSSNHSNRLCNSDVPKLIFVPNFQLILTKLQATRYREVYSKYTSLYPCICHYFFAPQVLQPHGFKPEDLAMFSVLRSHEKMQGQRRMVRC